MSLRFREVSGTYCDLCATKARWSIQNLEGDRMEPTTRWFACGVHLHRVLERGHWEVDAVQIMDLNDLVARS